MLAPTKELLQFRSVTPGTGAQTVDLCSAAEGTVVEGKGGGHGGLSGGVWRLQVVGSSFGNEWRGLMLGACLSTGETNRLENVLKDRATAEGTGGVDT